MDAIPVFSQTKSFVQWTCNDVEGAKQTQRNFSRQCPVVSQVRSAVEAYKGDKDAALETQKQFGSFVSCVVNGIPVVGHVKGAVHYALGDKEGGEAAMKASTHTSAVIGGGVGGFLLGGPVGAVAGGIGAGVAIDSTITAADSAINNTFKPYGVFEPMSDPTNPGKWCDAAGGIVLDGLTGKCAGNVVKQIQVNKLSRTSGVLDNVVDTVVQDRVIPRPIAPILGQVKLMVRLASEKLFFALANAGKAELEKQMSKVQQFAEKSCKLDMNYGNALSVGEKRAVDLGVSFQENGNVLEVYYKEKLILVKNGDLKYIANGKGGMEQIQDGFTYCLCSDGNFVLKPDLQASLEQNYDASVYEDASDKWFDAESTQQKFVEFVYDPKQKMILWGNANPEEEHQGLFIPGGRREVQRI